MAKRPIIDELVEGVAAMKSQREGKLTLRTYKVGPAPLPKVDSKLIKDARKKLRCSPAVFARRLPINERTLDKWEQRQATPNRQAAALVLLVRKCPQTLERLEEVAGGKGHLNAARQIGVEARATQGQAHALTRIRKDVVSGR